MYSMQVENGHNLAARGDDFPVAGKGYSTCHSPRRNENEIVQDRLDAIDLGLCTFDCGVCLVALRLARQRRRLASFHNCADVDRRSAGR